MLYVKLVEYYQSDVKVCFCPFEVNQRCSRELMNWLTSIILNQYLLGLHYRNFEIQHFFFNFNDFSTNSWTFESKLLVFHSLYISNWKCKQMDWMLWICICMNNCCIVHMFGWP